MSQKVFIKNRYGSDLCALKFVPENYTERCGVVDEIVLIALHGFIGFKEQRHITSMCHTANELGWVGYSLDLRGSGESYGNFEDDYRISNFVEDLHDVIDWVKANHSVKEIHLAGHSMGGQTALIVSSSREDIVSVVASQSPYDLFGEGSWGQKLAKFFEPIGFYMNVSPKHGVIKLPKDFFYDAIKWNALEFVDKLHIPVLYIVGEWDIVIPKEQTELLYDKTASVNKKIVSFKRMDHEYRLNKKHVENVRVELLKFWRSLASNVDVK